MTNNVFVGHLGMVIGEEEDTILYDPAGSYTSCKNNVCALGLQHLEVLVIFFEYPNFDWDDYLSYHRRDGDDIVVIESVIPKEQTEQITLQIYERNGTDAPFCATRTHNILKLSDGVFNSLDDSIYIRSP